MFMFRSRRTALTKQLVKARKRRTDETAATATTTAASSGSARRGASSTAAAASAATTTRPREMTRSSGCCFDNSHMQHSSSAEDASSSSCSSSPTYLQQQQQRQQQPLPVLWTLLKKLKENQLEMLLGAVESRGERLTNCVLLPREYEPHVLCCQIWRWPDVQHGDELRRLPCCRTAADPVYICCNPYHWSRLLQPEIPPPPYSRCAIERLKPEDRAPSEAPLVFRDSYIGSLTTNGEDGSLNPHEWCKLAYWELAQRVGPLFPVDAAAVNVFGDTVYGADGFSIKTLTQHRPTTDSVTKTRCKIGLGVILSREDDRIWLYNRSDYPVFINSPTLEDTSYPPAANVASANHHMDTSPSPTLSSTTRLPPEHCLCVYDPSVLTTTSSSLSGVGGGGGAPPYYDYYYNNTMIGGGGGGGNCCGPVDPNSIRVSFVKGWGGKYSRREITSCQCWLEILLAPCR